MTGTSQNVPKRFIRAPDHHLLPPRVGHNWNDQAFSPNQNRPQQLEGELLGRRAFLASSTGAGGASAPPEGLGESAQQLLLALSAKNPRTLRGSGAAGDGSDKKRPVSLDDKVLRFYAYLRERAPEGGANDYWHRRMVIHFYPEDDTVMIQEPFVPNSGLDGGTFLKRQKVRADPRQRELFPDEEYLTLNLFNVGASVRIHAHEFHLYDCDGFTRRFLTTLGVAVGEPQECPDDEFAEAYRRHELAQRRERPAPSAAEADAARTARFLRDGGTILRFKGVLDERAGGGIARRLELYLFVEDNSIAITEQATLAEATPGMFLSRCFLPKSGTLSKANELTFSHRVNGRREPEVGPEGIYKDVDLDIGTTLNVLGRPVLLYDCDDFTRSFYQQRHGIALRPAMTAEVEATYFPPRPTRRGGRVAGTGVQTRTTASPPDELRFSLVPSRPHDHAEGFRRFTLTYYTGTNEVTVYELSSDPRRRGGPALCLLRRQPLRRPVVPHGPRNAEVAAPSGDGPAVYGPEDFRVGSEVVVCGIPMSLIAMDAHTEAYFAGTGPAAPSAEAVERLLAELREFLGSRYGTAVKAFLAFDWDRDGRIGFDEFLASLKAFQITEDLALGYALFTRIAGGTAPTTGALAPADLMRWMGESAAADGGEAAVAAAAAAAATATSAAVDEREGQRAAITANTLRTRVLSELRERLTSRRMSGAGMFRLASTMPRAYRENRATVHTLFNPDRDARITPVQLRRCCEEILGTTLDREEMTCIMTFFYPTMPADEHFRRRDDTLDYAVDLPTFQLRFDEMNRLAMLPESKSKSASTMVVRTSIL